MENLKELEAVVELCLRQSPEKLRNIPDDAWRGYVNRTAESGDVQQLDAVLKHRGDFIPSSNAVNTGYKKLLTPTEMSRHVHLDQAVRLKELTGVSLAADGEFIDRIYSNLVHGARAFDMCRTDMEFNVHWHSYVAKVLYERLNKFLEFSGKKPGKRAAQTIQAAMLVNELIPAIRGLSHRLVEYKNLPKRFVIASKGTKVEGMKVINPPEWYVKLERFLGASEYSQRAVDFVHDATIDVIEKWGLEGWLSGMADGDGRLVRAFDQFYSLYLLSGREPSQEQRMKVNEFFFRQIIRYEDATSYDSMRKNYDAHFPLANPREVVMDFYKGMLSEEDTTQLNVGAFGSIARSTGIEVPLGLLSAFRKRYFQNGDPRFIEIHELNPKLAEMGFLFKGIRGDTAYNRFLDRHNFGPAQRHIQDFLRWVELSGVNPSQAVADRVYSMLWEDKNEGSKEMAVTVYQKLEIRPSDKAIRRYVTAGGKAEAIDSMIASLGR